MDQIGKYEVLDKIGSGGFAVVYKGYDPFIKRPVAIKVCYSRDEETRERFHREAEIAGRLVHRNITAVYDFGLHERMPYLVEEYLPGEDLAHMIRRHEPETLEEKLDVLLQIAGGLGYAHSRDVIHRDIKPSNVRILDNGRVKIMDFGTAKLANVESNLTQTGMTLGTVAYLSPERLLGEASGTNSDIFSFGVVAYELLAFKRPFTGKNIPHLIDQVLNTVPTPIDRAWPECPQSLGEVVHKCLLKDPAERYASCLELISDLEQVRVEHTTTVPAAARDTGSLPAGSDVRLSGLLERARELVGRAEHRRAEALLEEVLDIDPGNAEAERLIADCRKPPEQAETSATMPTQTLPMSTGTAEPTPSSATFEAPEARHRRKVSEAVASIENRIEARQLVRAAEELRFATEFLGVFNETATLRKSLAGALKTDVAAVQAAAIAQASRVVEKMTSLSDSDRLPIEPAERLVRVIEDFDPQDQSGKRLLATLKTAADEGGQTRSAKPPARKLAEAIDSIEQLLAEGDPATAEQALDFAVQLYGDFDQKNQLRERISGALRTSSD